MILIRALNDLHGPVAMSDHHYKDLLDHFPEPDTVTVYAGQHPVLGFTCSFCSRPAKYSRRVNPPDTSTLIIRFFCSTACEANWGTNQDRDRNNGL